MYIFKLLSVTARISFNFFIIPNLTKLSNVYLNLHFFSLFLLTAFYSSLIILYMRDYFLSKRVQSCGVQFLCYLLSQYGFIKTI